MCSSAQRLRELARHKPNIHRSDDVMWPLAEGGTITINRTFVHTKRTHDKMSCCKDAGVMTLTTQSTSQIESNHTNQKQHSHTLCTTMTTTNTNAKIGDRCCCCVQLLLLIMLRSSCRHNRVCLVPKKRTHSGKNTRKTRPSATAHGNGPYRRPQQVHSSDTGPVCVYVFLYSMR